MAFGIKFRCALPGICSRRAQHCGLCACAPSCMKKKKFTLERREEFSSLVVHRSCKSNTCASFHQDFSCELFFAAQLASSGSSLRGLSLSCCVLLLSCAFSLWFSVLCGFRFFVVFASPIGVCVLSVGVLSVCFSSAVFVLANPGFVVFFNLGILVLSCASCFLVGFLFLCEIWPGRYSPVITVDIAR